MHKANSFFMLRFGSVRVASIGASPVALAEWVCQLFTDNGIGSTSKHSTFVRASEKSGQSLHSAFLTTNFLHCEFRALG